jgi:hypothetical protein
LVVVMQSNVDEPDEVYVITLGGDHEWPFGVVGQKLTGTFVKRGRGFRKEVRTDVGFVVLSFHTQPR